MRTNELAAAHRRLTDAMQEARLTLAFIDQERVVVGIPEQTGEHCAAVREIAGRVPLTIVRAAPARRHAKKQDLNRPLVGGIAIKCEEAGDIGLGTICINASRGHVEGFVTAGHVVGAVGRNVYQPRRSEMNDWRVGASMAVSDFSRRADSDSAFVELIGTAFNAEAIWRTSATTYTKTGVVIPIVGTAVAMQGGSNQQTERTGTIFAVDVTVNFADGGMLEHQMLATYLTNEGDSGAPVYKKEEGSNVSLVGLNVGATEAQFVTPEPAAGTYAVVSTWAHIRADLELD